MRVVSWNVLADAYVRPEFFPKADPSFLTSSYRRAEVIKILQDYDADVMMLQEVEPSLLDELRSIFSSTHNVFFTKLDHKPAGVATIVSKKYGILNVGTVQVTCDTLLVNCEFDELSFVLCNSHLKWALESTPVVEHPGIIQLTALEEVLKLVPSVTPVIFGADTNATPGSHVRNILQKWVDLSPSEATSLFAGNELRNLDVLLGRGDISAHKLLSFDPFLAYPSKTVPSDHIPVAANIHFTK